MPFLLFRFLWACKENENHPAHSNRGVIMKDLKPLLDQLEKKYNTPNFIENDPIGIPHRYTLKQDIEVTAFWTAILAWGQRKTIINKATELFEMMDNQPYDFILETKV